MSSKQIAEAIGLQMETHEVVTKDGYVLTMFRVFKDSTSDTENKPVIFFQHGLSDTADSMMINKELSPVYYLIQAGYDVWLGNNRGNKYSQRHLELDPWKDSKFWSYSFQEMGQYDTRA